jgi:SAM-dependent methyltransferase
MFGIEAAKVYDAAYADRGKDYHGEARVVVEQIRARYPHARTLLDVACGTGQHLGPFTDLLGHCEGLEVSPQMLATARANHPDKVLHQGDMRCFELGRTFDAVTCLFASIGYVESEAELGQALECFARHVAPGGVVAVEPWWFPDRVLDTYVSANLVEVEGQSIARIVHSVTDNGASRMEIHYVVADPREPALRHVTEMHRVMLFTQEQYEDAFERAGLKPEYVDGVQYGRGLFVGVRT